MGTKRSEVAVVGAGLAGLAVAAYAARGGRRVTLLERAKRHGGRATTRREQGFALNLGAHALYRRGPAQAVLAELGVRYTGKSPDPRGLADCDGKLHKLPTGPAALFGTRLLSWRDKATFGRLFAQLPRLSTQPLDGAPWGEWLQTISRSPRVQQTLAAFGRLSCYENDPATTSAGANLAQLQKAVRDGVLYLDGGWQTLVDGLATAAQSAGAELEIEAAVERLESDGDGWQVQCADGRSWHATHVVLALDARAARQLAPQAIPAHVAAAARPVWVACLDLALSSLPCPERKFVLGIDRPLYMSVHSAAAQLAPPGMALVQIMKYQGPADDAEPNALADELEAFADRVQPGWRERLALRQFLPKMQAASAEVRADAGGLAGRPAVASPTAPGLLLAGDWVGYEGLLVDAVLASARCAARHVLAQSGGSHAAFCMPRTVPA